MLVLNGYIFLFQLILLKDGLNLYKYIMLNIRQLKFASKRIGSTYLLKQMYWLTNYKVRDVRGQYMYVIEDPQQKLQYMREVETTNGRRGIVLKFQQQGNTYIGMYQPIPSDQQNTLNLKSSNIPWQLSFEGIIPLLESQSVSVLNVNATPIYDRKEKLNSIQSQPKKRKLISLHPLLDICYDLNYGEMFNFSGCQGSLKTTTLTNIFRQFGQHHNHYALYFNPTSFSDAQRATEEAGCWSFNNGSHDKTNQSDVGVYMLALKTINLAKKLSLLGKQVVIGLDNFKSVLHAEWHMLQMLNNVRRGKQPSGVNYNALKIAPISLLNQIYSICGDNQKTRGTKKKGSLSAIIVTDNNKDDELMPEITPYTNNLKHLSSLSQTIKFPLVASQNSNIKSSVTLQQQSSTHHQRILRHEINNYLQQKKDTQLKRKLYRSDMTDAPWDYFSILDADWWLEGLRQVKPNSEQKMADFISWTALNIELQLVSHWNIKSYDAYSKFIRWLSEQGRTQIDQANVLQFMDYSKSQGWFSPFKKDYLK